MPWSPTDSEVEGIAREIAQLVSVPSVSSEPERAPDCRRAAELLRDALEAAGARGARLLETPLHPAVFGELPGPPGAPTALVYGHYDVMPVSGQAWSSPPFEPGLRDGALYGRGSTDDKGNLFLALAAARELGRSAGGLPLGLKFLFEGEEEIGSPNIESLLEANRAELSCDAIFCADGGMFGERACSIAISARGGIAFKAIVRGPRSDLHSGAFGGAVRNPLHVLAEMIAALHDSDGRVAVPGFYDRVRPPGRRDREEAAALPFDARAFRAECGPEFGEPGFSAVERIGLRPTVEVTALHGGSGNSDPASPANAIVPARAWCSLACRTVADMDPAETGELVKGFLRSRLPEGMGLEFVDRACFRDYEVPRDLPALATAMRALREVYGEEPLAVRDGGGLPLRRFQEKLGIPAVIFAFTRDSDNEHGGDERFPLASMKMGLASWTRLFELLGGARDGKGGMVDDREERLIRIETKLSYQEAAIADLSEALVGQEEKIAALEALAKALREKLKELSGEGQPPLPTGERPPHY